MNYFVADFNYIALDLGWFSIKWYGLAYAVSFILCWQYAKLYLKQHSPSFLDKKTMDNLFIWMVLGVLLGGRLGYIFFYKPQFYLSNPIEVFYVWEGGMAFHGALLGVAISLFLFCKKYKKHFWSVADMLSVCAPIGLFLGRVANFINGELWGRPTDVSWAVIFPRSFIPRHPSQLYEAATEGFLLFLILWFAAFINNMDKQPGRLTGIFSIGYACFRFGVEFFREPDAHIGYLWLGFSMGQYLTVPLFIIGIYLLLRPVHSNDFKRNP